MKTQNILCINGSLRGSLGNTARVIDYVRTHAPTGANIELLCLADACMTMAELHEHLHRADAFLLCSGVYWNSCGSHLQRFLEVVTAWETTDLFFAKPAGVVLTMDSVGGMEVASRLASVLNLLGCTVPPLGVVVLSRVAHSTMHEHTMRRADEQDVYHLPDVSLLVDNLAACGAAASSDYRRWPVKPTRSPQGSYPGCPALHIDHHPWLDI